MTGLPPDRPFAAGVRIVVVLLVALSGAWLVASLLWPYQQDHGVYAWIARVSLAGGAPYVDAWDVKGPLASIPFLVSSAVLGDGSWAIRLVDGMLVLGTAIAMVVIVTRVSGLSAGLLTGALWVLSYARLGFTNTAQPDGWVGMLTFLAAAPAMRDGRLPGASLVAMGAAAGFATFVKPMYVLLLVLPLLVAWTAMPRRRIALALASLAGFAVVVVLTVVWLRSHDALAAMYDAYLGFNFGKNSGGMLSVALAALSYGLLTDPTLLLLAPVAAAGIVVASRRPQLRRTALIVVVMTAVGVLAALVQRPWFDYRSLPMLPPLVLASGLAWRGMGSATPVQRPLMRALLLTPVALLTLHVSREPVADVYRAARVASGQLSRPAYDALFASHGATAREEHDIASLMRALAKPGDSALVWVHLPVLSYSGVPSASRAPLAVTLQGAPEPWRSRFAVELADVIGRQPAFLVLEAPSASDTAFGQLDPIRLLTPPSSQPPAYDLAMVRGPLRLFVRR